MTLLYSTLLYAQRGATRDAAEACDTVVRLHRIYKAEANQGNRFDHSSSTSASTYSRPHSQSPQLGELVEAALAQRADLRLKSLQASTADVGARAWGCRRSFYAVHISAVRTRGGRTRSSVGRWVVVRLPDHTTPSQFLYSLSEAAAAPLASAAGYTGVTDEDNGEGGEGSGGTFLYI
jgi:hypothetical protein